jgi:hypothetical protein
MNAHVDPRRPIQIALVSDAAQKAKARDLAAIMANDPPALNHREVALALAIRAYRDNPVHLRTALAAIIPAELGDIGSLVWSHIARVS